MAQMISHPPYRLECRICMKVYWSRETLVKHRRECISNHNAYLKIGAPELDHTDSEAKENWNRIRSCAKPKAHQQVRRGSTSRHETPFDHVERDAPLTPKFIQNLGAWSDEEVVRALNSKRKRVTAEDDLAISNLAPLPNPNASNTSRRTYRAPSSPRLEDLLPSPSMASTVSYSHPPALNITHPQPQVQRQRTSNIVSYKITQKSPESEDSVYLGDFTSSFDLAFAKWLDGENISKAAIGRLPKDPAIQPITSKLSWNSVAKMKYRLASIEFNEDDE